MFWLVKDSCGILCITLAWVLMAFSQYALLTVVLLPQTDQIWKYIHLAFFQFFFFLALVSHIRTIFTDPGSVSRESAIETPGQNTRTSFSETNSPLEPPVDNRNLYKCPECCSIKPARAHHCSVCKRCIRKMDHHCPWVNNCVGERNQKFFILFTLYITIISIHALCLAVRHFFICLEADWSSNSTCPTLNRAGRPSPESLVMMVFLSFEALLFSLFSAIMFCLQIKAVWNDWTEIDNLKKVKRDRQSGCVNLRNIFGTNWILWLSPFTKSPTCEALNLGREDEIDPDKDNLSRHGVGNSNDVPPPALECLFLS